MQDHDPLAEARALYREAKAHRRAGRWDPAVAAYTRVRQLLLDANQALAAAACLHVLGNVHESRGAWDAAVAAYSQAHSVFADGGQPLDAARCLLGLGNVHWARGDWDAAATAYTTAHQVFDHGGQPLSAAACLNGLGHVHRARGDWDAAATAYTTAHQVFDHGGQPLDAARCLNGLGNVHWARGDWDAAATAYTTAHQVFDHGGQPLSAAACLNGLGHVHRARGDWDAAATAYTSAHEVFVSGGVMLDAAACSFNLALVLRDSGDRSGAVVAAADAVALVDRWRYTMRTSADRVRWTQLKGSYYRLAFELAERTGDGRLLAELVESARVQALPVPPPTENEEDGSSDVSASALAVLLADPPGGRPRPSPGGGTLSASLSAASGMSVSAGVLAAAQAVGIVDERGLAGSHAIVIDGLSGSGGLSRLGSARLAAWELVADVAGERVPGWLDGEAWTPAEGCRRAMGGPHGWWWGTWPTGDGRVAWTVIAPDGQIESGLSALPAELLDRLARHVGELDDTDAALIGEAAARRARSRGGSLQQVQERVSYELARLSGLVINGRQRTGLLGLDSPAHHTYQAELADHGLDGLLDAAPAARAAHVQLFTELADALLPDMLAEALRAGQVDRLIVAASPTLANVPVGLLILDTNTDGRLVRVWDRTVVTGAPSMAVIASTLPAPDGGDRAGHVLAVAPGQAGRVLHALAPAPDARVTLAEQNATKPAMLKQLAALGDADGVVSYLGHLMPGVEHPGQAGLQLADGVLTVADLLDDEDPVPHRWLLTGCRGDDARHPEYLTVVPALMARGARHVITTRWTLPDHRATQQLHHDLTALCVDSNDPAATLQHHQQTACAAWWNTPTGGQAAGGILAASHTHTGHHPAAEGG